MALTRKELEELRPWVESTVAEELGISEPSVAHTALGCMEKGLDKRKTKATLLSLLDDRVATRFVDRLFLELDLQKAALSSSPASKIAAKRNRPAESDIAEMIKKTRYEAAAANGNAAAAAAANNNLPPQQQSPGFALPSATLAALNAVAARVDNVPDVNDPKAKKLHPYAAAASIALPQLGPAATAVAAHSAAAATQAAALQQKQLHQQQLEADATASPPAPLTLAQIKAMMENAKKMIAEKKAAAGIGRAGTTPFVTPSTAAPTPPVAAPPMTMTHRLQAPPRPMFPTGATMGGTTPSMPLPEEEPDLPIPSGRSKFINAEEQDKLKRAAQLQASIKAKLQSMTMVPDLMEVESKAKEAAEEAAKIAATASKKAQAPRLIIDSQGRTLDADGNEITIAPRAPELKANLRASQRSGLASVIPGTQSIITRVDPPVNKYLDNRIDLKAAGRNTKRAFKFHDAGKFQQLASRLRTKAQLEKLQNQVSLAAKKTGISSAARLAGLVMPKMQETTREGETPPVEWWDYYILDEPDYDCLASKGSDAINFEVITNLIEHPLQLQPPTEGEGVKAVSLPIMLTKRERKKMRRQTRNEALKEKTERVRLGLEAPPEPKMRISNLMRVLGTEAVADPTKMEAHVRAQMAKRQRAHEEANAARKLTPEQRSEKKTKKMAEDTTGGVLVAVYRIKSLADPAKKFKVETNANQLQMTGAVVMCKDNNIVIVEGGPKQHKKFRRLLLHRIKWEEASRKEKKEESSEESSSASSSSKNVCSLVWEGTVLKRSFGEIKFKVCPTESFAREHLRQRDVEHYWDIAHADSVIESSVD